MVDNQKNNIWEQVLKEASTIKEIVEPHVFILGDKNSGKRQIIRAMNKEMYLNYETEERTLPPLDEGVSRFSQMEYKYLNVKKTDDTENGK
jgi:hypothetical protein